MKRLDRISLAIFECISAAVLVFMFVNLAVRWGGIPVSTPSYADKAELFIVPLIALGVYVLLTAFSLFSGAWAAFADKLPEEEKKRAVSNIRGSLAAVKSMSMTIFAGLNLTAVDGVKPSSAYLFFSVILMATAIVVMLVTIFVAARKAGK